MRAATLFCAIAVAGVCQSASAAVSFPSLGSGAATYSGSAPTGNSYVQLHAVPLTNQAAWMPKSSFSTYAITPAGDGSVTLNLGATLRWDSHPTDQWGGLPNDIRRYFALGYSLDGGSTVNWQSYNSYYPANGYNGDLVDMPAGAWTRQERQFAFNVATTDGATPVSWFYREDRTIDVVRYGGNINPVDISFDDMTVTVNGTNLMTSGNFEVDQATLDTQRGFWFTQATSTQSIVAVPEPTSLALLAIPAIMMAGRRRHD